MQEFEVKGPFVIIPTSCKKGPSIDDESMKIFWRKYHEYKDKRGIYAYGIRAGKGYTPWYVGQTKRSFEDECSDPSKMKIYNQIFMNHNGTPVIFLVLQDTYKRGPKNNSILKHVEDYLIDIALTKNSELYNTKGTKKPEWSIIGVIKSTQGRPSKESSEFKNFIGLQGNF